ncbi:nitronate monooxygenase [bacterium]|nr:nitronate monooxygenase [bacterium]
MTWPDRRILDLLGIELPILLAPMAGAASTEMAIAVSRAGGLGALACAMLTAEQLRQQVGIFRQRTPHPINLNFICHRPVEPDPEREKAWKRRLEHYYRELGLDPDAPTPKAERAPFDSTMAGLVAACRPEVVSFHFGLPSSELMARVKASGAKVLSSATTVEEAVWLERHGCDAIIAQGIEAGGHRGMFLSRDPATQLGTMALVPQVVDAVKVPVIAAGGIADGRGIAAAFALGAAAVQIGTAYLRCPEATITALHRQALQTAGADQTALTNVFTGRPARSIVNRLVREIGPLSDLVPEFPLAASVLAPLRARAEASGSAEFSSLWAGQAFHLARELPADELTRQLASEALGLLRSPSC